MGRRLDAAADRRRLEVYATAKSDREAAQALGLDPSTFRNWRLRHSLPAKNKPFVEPEEHARRTAAWAETENVPEAARRLGMEVGAFDSWMRQQGLRSRQALRTPDLGAEHSKHFRYLRAYHQARSDAEAASLLKVPAHAFARWRRRNKLPETSTASQQRLEKERAARRASRP